VCAPDLSHCACFCAPTAPRAGESMGGSEVGDMAPASVMAPPRRESLWADLRWATWPRPPLWRPRRESLWADLRWATWPRPPLWRLPGRESLWAARRRRAAHRLSRPGEPRSGEPSGMWYFLAYGLSGSVSVCYCTSVLTATARLRGRTGQQCYLTGVSSSVSVEGLHRTRLSSL